MTDDIKPRKTGLNGAREREKFELALSMRSEGTKAKYIVQYTCMFVPQFPFYLLWLAVRMLVVGVDIGESVCFFKV